MAPKAAYVFLVFLCAAQRLSPADALCPGWAACHGGSFPRPPGLHMRGVQQGPRRSAPAPLDAVMRGSPADKLQSRAAALMLSFLVAWSPSGQPVHASVDPAVQQASRPVLQVIESMLVSAPQATAIGQATTAATERISVPRRLQDVQPWRYSEFLDAVERHEVFRVTFSPDCQRLLARTVAGGQYVLRALPEDPSLVATLTRHNVDIIVLEGEDERAVGVKSVLFFSALLLANGLVLLWQGFNAGTGNPGKPFPVQASNSSRVTFADVEGASGAKEELQEIVEFLKEPSRFTDLGARIPRGVILDGPPGTGKTLLARAVAGEAGVPFFSISGSEFVEMYVGLGAARVRELFAQAKKVAPCIIFIDEIDAVGGKRQDRGAGGSDERANTLNQLLTEMDGFEGNPGIIVLAATNRAEVLDGALLRPGRFDRRITVALPDFAGRVGILGVHARGKPLAEDVDLAALARRTSVCVCVCVCVCVFMCVCLCVCVYVCM